MQELIKVTITEQAPMVDYYKTAMSATDTVDMEGAVKVLGLPFGRNTLLKKLREMKILMPNNHPYQQHVNSGYFKLIQTTYNKPNGSTYTYYKTVVFPKGLDAIKRLLTKSPKNNVQPLFDNSQPATA